MKSIFRQGVRNIISDNSKTTVKASEATSDNEQPATSQKIIKYSFERPKAREGETIKTRISELCKKYPNFQEIYDNIEKCPNNLLAALGNNPDMIDYVKKLDHPYNGRSDKFIILFIIKNSNIFFYQA